MRVNSRKLQQAGWLTVLVAAALLFLFSRQVAGFVVDWLWFGEVGQRHVFWTILVAQVQLALLFGVLFFLVMFLNVWLARRATPTLTPRYDDFPIRVRVGRLARTGLSLLLLGGSLVAGFLAGLEASGHWDEYLRFLHPVSFGRFDPIFHLDIGFFVFRFPFWSYLYDWGFLALLLVTLATLLVYYFDRAVEVLQGYAHVAPPVRVHISILLGLIALLKAWGYRLDAYGLLYSTNGSFFGAGYTDVHARLLALNLLFILAIVAAAGFFLNAVLRLLWLPGATLALMVVASVVLGGFYPGFVQRFRVQPNELVTERPYIDRHLKMTQSAYGLDQVVASGFGQTAPLTPANVERNQGTIQNIRLWDYRPLQQTYEQLQILKPYYSFPDIDIDRYTLRGQERQVMLAARELKQNDLPDQARLWVNEWLEYTHSYGFVMNPVNEATPDGGPVLWAKDAPQESLPELPATRPQIYFGIADTAPVIAPSRTPEFDYPIENEAARTRYTGSGGVPVGGSLSRLLFATYFGETNLLLSNSIEPDSRILFNRKIDDRAAKIAPFLAYDKDSYLVLAEGRLFWIQDAYTTSDHYPYSLPAGDYALNIRHWDGDSLQTDDGSFNYARNSVKIVTDAYNGSVQFYVADSADPVVRCYQAIFPSLFRPLNEMPASLRSHIRYPEGLFTVQAHLYANYHVKDPAIFFQRSDQWKFPQEQVTTQRQQMVPGEGGLPVPQTVTDTGSQPMEPFYVTMRLPDGKGEEFVLMLPYELEKSPNMPAWLCARCDGDEYGRLRAYLFPTGVNGPSQAESFIEQNPDISSALSLWNQHGSRVISGNLLALLVDQSILYVKPIYLAAESRPVPRLTRVILVNEGRVVMRPTLGEALAALVSGETGGVTGAATTQAGAVSSPPSSRTTPAASAPAVPAAPTGTVSSLINQANQELDAATKAQRSGDWASYGDQLQRLQQTLRELHRRTGALK
jgi:uncharacterized membrane protein (UPF0182 family)